MLMVLLVLRADELCIGIGVVSAAGCFARISLNDDLFAAKSPNAVGLDNPLPNPNIFLVGVSFGSRVNTFY